MHMESSAGNIRDLYALLSLCNPDLISPFRSKIAKQHIVSAKLVAAHHIEATTKLTAVDNKEYVLPLNLHSRIYQSKGDWVWVSQIQVIYPSDTIISMPINPRVIDIPYTGSSVCAHWLFKNINKELTEELSKRIQ